MSPVSTLEAPDLQERRGRALPRLSTLGSPAFSRLVIRLLLLLLVTCGAMAVLGYHPGVEDDATYLASIEHDLNPALFPHDLAFVSGQMQLSLFDGMIAECVRITKIPLPWVELLGQFAGLYLLLLACWEIIALCYEETAARWGGVCFVGVMLAMPVSMTGLFLADQHLHPRLLATDCMMFAVLAILKGRGWLALPLLVAGTLMHPLMAAFGISFCCFLGAEKWRRERSLDQWDPLEPEPRRSLRRTAGRAAALVLPSSPTAAKTAGMAKCWLWESPNAAWARATAPRRFLYLYKWPLWGWFTILGPIGLVAWLRKIARQRGETNLHLLCTALLTFSAFQLAVAMVLLLPVAPRWFVQFEPMRFLYTVYLLAALLGAGAFARFWLRGSVAKWLLIFLPLTATMYADQMNEFAGSPHFEWPGSVPTNPWLEAFAWIRHNTPETAYFAVDPRYDAVPGEGVHSFRALAERSMLADDLKDADIVTHIPHLGPRWIRETAATEGWSHFQTADFERLRRQFGVTWVLVARPQPQLACPYNNGVLWVCRL